MDDCQGFHWIGQSWETCDECGRPWHEHEGYWLLKRGAGPFDDGTDAWELVPWRAGAVATGDNHE